MAGEVASTFLSRLAVPVLYYLSERHSDTQADQRDTPHSKSSLAPTATINGASQARQEGSLDVSSEEHPL